MGRRRELIPSSPELSRLGLRYRRRILQRPTRSCGARLRRSLAARRAAAEIGLTDRYAELAQRRNTANGGLTPA